MLERWRMIRDRINQITDRLAEDGEYVGYDGRGEGHITGFWGYRGGLVKAAREIEKLAGGALSETALAPARRIPYVVGLLDRHTSIIQAIRDRIGTVLAASPDGPHVDAARALLDLADLADKLDGLIEAAEFAKLEHDDATGTRRQLVTLEQAAGVVSRAKSTLRKLVYAGRLPQPAVRGELGKAHEWDWAEMRPALESYYNCKLPRDFPGIPRR